jgi:hypothetical protein
MNSENTNIQHNTTSDNITLKELIVRVRNWYKFLLSKWLIILCFGLLGGLLGFMYANSQKPLYTATTTFVLEEGSSSGAMGQYAGLASIAGINLGGDGGGIFQGDNILELYKSRIMIEKTLLTEVEHNGTKQLLIETYLDFNKTRESWKDKPLLKNLSFKDTSPNLSVNRVRDSVLSVVVKDISENCLIVRKPNKTLSIIKADVKSSNEFFSKEFNDNIVMNVNEFYVRTKTKKSLENISILQQKTDSVRSVMNGAIYAASSIIDATPNLNPTRQTQRIAPVQRSQFNAESNKAVLMELLKNLEMSKIAYRKETPLIQVIDEPILPLEKERLGRAKGLIFGGSIAGFLTIIFLIIRRLLKDLLSN